MPITFVFFSLVSDAETTAHLQKECRVCRNDTKNLQPRARGAEPSRALSLCILRYWCVKPFHRVAMPVGCGVSDVLNGKLQNIWLQDVQSRSLIYQMILALCTQRDLCLGVVEGAVIQNTVVDKLNKQPSSNLFCSLVNRNWCVCWLIPSNCNRIFYFGVKKKFFLKKILLGYRNAFLIFHYFLFVSHNPFQFMWDLRIQFVLLP